MTHPLTDPLDNVGNVWALDNVGITLNVRTLECWPAYRAAQAALFGTHRLSRFWMRHIYWRIWPRQYEMRRLAWEGECEAMRVQFIKAVIEAALNE